MKIAESLRNDKSVTSVKSESILKADRKRYYGYIAEINMGTMHEGGIDIVYRSYSSKTVWRRGTDGTRARVCYDREGIGGSSEL